MENTVRIGVKVGKHAKNGIESTPDYGQKKNKKNSVKLGNA